jgi:hypothetical protein
VDEKTRPSGYSLEISEAILNRIMQGEMLTKICQEDGMPAWQAYYRWLDGRPELKEAHARARLAWADYWAERVMAISLDRAGDIFIEDGKAVADHARIQRDKLITDNIKWLVGKYAPRTYGDKPQEDAGDSKQLTITWEARDPLPPPPPPKQIAYDPGPLPKSLDPEVLVKMVGLIKRHVPRASDRDPATVLNEVLSVIERALIAEYGATDAPPKPPQRLRRRGARHANP